jgi:hypothetical protein
MPDARRSSGIPETGAQRTSLCGDKTTQTRGETYASSDGNTPGTATHPRTYLEEILVPARDTNPLVYEGKTNGEFEYISVKDSFFFVSKRNLMICWILG